MPYSRGGIHSHGEASTRAAEGRGAQLLGPHASRSGTRLGARRPGSVTRLLQDEKGTSFCPAAARATLTHKLDSLYLLLSLSEGLVEEFYIPGEQEPRPLHLSRPGARHDAWQETCWVNLCSLSDRQHNDKSRGGPRILGAAPNQSKGKLSCFFQEGPMSGLLVWTCIPDATGLQKTGKCAFLS